MTQYDYSISAANSGPELATALTSWKAALHSCHRGPSRPSYAVAGMLWVYDGTDQSPAATPELRYFDGAADIALGVIDEAANTFTPAGVDFSAIAADVIPDADSTRDLGASATAFAEVWVDEIGHPGGGKVASETVVEGTAKAWINLNGAASTPVARDSFNVSSVTDRAAGRYTVNLTAAFGAADYACASNGNATAGDANLSAFPATVANNKGTSAFWLEIFNGSSYVDASVVDCAAWGDLA